MTPTRRHRPVAWAISSVVVIALGAGAFSLAVAGKPYTSTTVVLSEAAARTTHTGTARIHATASATVDGHAQKIADIDGATDYATKAGTVTLHLGAIDETMRAVGGVSYISVPGVALPGGAHWVSLTAADLKLDPNARATMGSDDPSNGLGFLSAVDGNPHLVGRGTVDGAAVTHYSFTLDFKAYFAQLGKADATIGNSSSATALESLGSLFDLSSVPGEAWIDNTGRVRRFGFTIAASTEGHTLNVVEDFEFSHFDEPVVVEPPAASDTVALRAVPDFFSKIAAAARASVSG